MGEERGVLDSEQRKGIEKEKTRSLPPLFSLTFSFLFLFFHFPFFFLRFFLAKMGREEEDYPGTSSLSSSWSVESAARPKREEKLDGESERAKKQNRSSTFAVSGVDVVFLRSRHSAPPLFSRPLFVPLACFSSLRACALRTNGAKRHAFVALCRGEQPKHENDFGENQSTIKKTLSRLSLSLSLFSPSDVFKNPHSQPTDEVEERLVNEEYKIWKKNTPFLYGEPLID